MAYDVIHQMKKALYAAGAVVLLIAVFALIRFGKYLQRQSNERQCIASMSMVWSAAVSYSLENKLDQDTLVAPTNFADFFRGSVVPSCPSGSQPYLPFVVRMGPRCPNMPEHHREMMADTCAWSRNLAWDLAISYAREHQLSWTNTIGAHEINVQLDKVWDQVNKGKSDPFRNYGKLLDPKCPLATKEFPAFILSAGPRCPNDEMHNQSYKPRILINTNYFDSKGRVLTNVAW